MSRNYRIALLAALLLAGCKSTQEVGQEARMRWMGQPVNSFFSQHGPARSEQVMQDGTVMYEWRGGEERVMISPGGTTTPPPQKLVENTTIRSMAPDGQYRTRTVRSELIIPQEPVTQPARYADLACYATITADKKGIITGFAITHDTIGKWDILSRCSEVIGK